MTRRLGELVIFQIHVIRNDFNILILHCRLNVTDQTVVASSCGLIRLSVTRMLFPGHCRSILLFKTGRACRILESHCICVFEESESNLTRFLPRFFYQTTQSFFSEEGGNVAIEPLVNHKHWHQCNHLWTQNELLTAIEAPVWHAMHSI